MLCDAPRGAPRFLNPTFGELKCRAASKSFGFYAGDAAMSDQNDTKHDA
jgi:hypothetical protein